MKLIHRYFSVFCLLVLLSSCLKENKLDIDVSDIDLNLDVKRFDQAFYNSNPQGLLDLKKTYPYLFPIQTSDSIWVKKMRDTDELELFAATESVYQNFDDQEEQLTTLFKHVNYYYPNFKAPKVITLLSNVDYERKVIYADSLLLLSLDVYLGADNTIYQDFPAYIKDNFTKEHLVVDVANEITKVQIPLSEDRSFVSRMIQQGKRMYLLDAYLPKVADAEKMGYSQEQIDWAAFNDEDVWKYFVQNKMLFSTEHELSKRFIDQAPFSKFYQANDNETPGSIGVWFGWQIVRAYMKNNSVDLDALLKTKNQEIFKKSKYKPTK